MEEIREIPEGWEHISLNNVGQIITGNTPDTNEYRYYDGKYMFIGPIDINENTLYIRESEKTITEIGLEQTRKIPANSICTVCIGSTIGKIGITSNTCATNQQINTLITNKDNDYKLIFYAMKYYLQDQLRVEAGLQAVPIVNKNRFSQLKLLVPKSKQEQQQISKILSTIDQNIEKTEQTIEKYINIKNGLMDDLLTGKRRIKDGKWVVETEFKVIDGRVRIPKDWEEGVISDLAEINPKKNIKKLNKEDLVSFIRMEDTSEESKIINMSDKMLSEVEKGYSNFHDNDILFAKITPCLENGKGGLASNLTNGIGFGSTEFHVLRPKKTYSTQLLYQYSKYNKLRAKAASLMIGSAGQQRIQKDFFESYIIGIPTENEQTIIGDILSKQDQLIEKEQQYLQKLKSLKSGLMEDLLTGKVRVK